MNKRQRKKRDKKIKAILESYDRILYETWFPNGSSMKLPYNTDMVTLQKDIDDLRDKILENCRLMGNVTLFVK